MRHILHFIDLDVQPWWEEQLAAQGTRQLEDMLRRQAAFDHYYTTSRPASSDQEQHTTGSLDEPARD